MLIPDEEGRRSTDASFVAKGVLGIRRGLALVVVDLFPSAETNIHTAIWGRLAGRTYSPPTDKPLTLASYAADDPPTAYLESLAVGDELADMPLFLAPDQYIPVPLESSYRAAFAAVPARWRRVLEV